MPLSDTKIRSAKPLDKPYKLSDGEGLYLQVTPNGSRLWRLKYRFEGKEKLLALGSYPEVGLAEARKRRMVAREDIAMGIDPSREKQLAKAKSKAEAEITFNLMAAEFCKKRKSDGEGGWSPATAKRSEYLLSLLHGNIGRMPITKIKPIEVLTAIRRIENKGNLESAKRTMQLAGSVFRYAIATARLESDPTRDLRGALLSPKVTHYGAVTTPQKAGELLRAIEGYDGYGLTKIALQIAPHVFVRPGELRHGEWQEVDFEKAVWILPAEKMKMRKAHHVPLSRQALALFRELYGLTGPDGFILPSVRTRARPMSENTINSGLRRLGYSTTEMTAHGFRAMASTLLNECGHWSYDAIERALAHGDANKVRAAYHRGAHWDERVKMAQWWSDYLDYLRDGGDPSVVPPRDTE
jgi:integrase